MGPCFPAKFSGKCWLCGERWQVGEPIRYVTRGAMVHEDCVPDVEADEALMARDWHEGQKVSYEVNGRVFTGIVTNVEVKGGGTPTVEYTLTIEPEDAEEVSWVGEVPDMQE